MTRHGGRLILATFLTWSISAPIVARGDDPAGPFQGEWRTTIGLVTLTQAGDQVTGTYGHAAQFSIKGTVRGKVLTFEYQEGALKGDGQFTLSNRATRLPAASRSAEAASGDWQRLAARPRRGPGRARQLRRPVAHRPRPDGVDPDRREGQRPLCLPGDSPARRRRDRPSGSTSSSRASATGPGWFDHRPTAINRRRGRRPTASPAGTAGAAAMPPSSLAACPLVAGKIVDGSTATC